MFINTLFPRWRWFLYKYIYTDFFVTRVMSGNFLRHELKHYDDASVDLEDVLHNAHDLLLLVRPLFAVYQKLDQIRR